MRYESQYYITDPSPNDITHFGILGQKWGVRRYQNEDGTYTEEGKARRSGNDKPWAIPEEKNWKRKDVKYLSDDELNTRNSRLQREKQYKDLMENPVKKWLKGTLTAVFLTTAITQLKGPVSTQYKTILEKGIQKIAKLKHVVFHH